MIRPGTAGLAKANGRRIRIRVGSRGQELPVANIGNIGTSRGSVRPARRSHPPGPDRAANAQGIPVRVEVLPVANIDNIGSPAPRVVRLPSRSGRRSGTGKPTPQGVRVANIANIGRTADIRPRSGDLAGTGIPSGPAAALANIANIGANFANIGPSGRSVAPGAPGAGTSTPRGVSRPPVPGAPRPPLGRSARLGRPAGRWRRPGRGDRPSGSGSRPRSGDAVPCLLPSLVVVAVHARPPAGPGRSARVPAVLPFRGGPLPSPVFPRVRLPSRGRLPPAGGSPPARGVLPAGGRPLARRVPPGPWRPGAVAVALPPPASRPVEGPSPVPGLLPPADAPEGWPAACQRGPSRRGALLPGGRPEAPVGGVHGRTRIAAPGPGRWGGGLSSPRYSVFWNHISHVVNHIFGVSALPRQGSRRGCRRRRVL
jgi:hypothetical protein